ncbi:MAG: LuxR C-terminal-related transcriptional regulator [Nitrospirota bacterium]
MLNSRLLKTLLSKKDALRLLELIHELTLCSNEADFRKIITALQEVLPHERNLTGIAKLSNGRIGKYGIINVSYPSEWLESQIVSRNPNDDPVARANYSKFRLQYFSDIPNEFPYPKGYLELGQDLGLAEGYVHGMRNQAGSVGSCFCFAGRRMKRDLRTEIIITLTVPHMHQALGRCLAVYEQVPRGHNCLSCRETEVLKWLKEGKSTWDISVILGISERTVKFHTSNIMQKLDASTRTHAVAIAIEQGLIDID